VLTAPTISRGWIKPHQCATKVAKAGSPVCTKGDPLPTGIDAAPDLDVPGTPRRDRHNPYCSRGFSRISLDLMPWMSDIPDDRRQPEPTSSLAEMLPTKPNLADATRVATISHLKAIRMPNRLSHIAIFAFAALAAAPALATPEFVQHTPSTQVFGEPLGTTMREPQVPREDEPTDLWIQVGYSFFYTDVAIYYTTDGSAPTGLRGVPSSTTQVLRSSASQITFIRNEPSPSGNIDWWRAPLPGSLRSYNQTIRYTIGAWHTSGGPEVYANNSGCSDNTCDNPANPAAISQFTNMLAWPGAGAGQENPAAGYPPISFWKEEAIIGNTFCAGQIDQNATYYDFHFPTPGGIYGVGTRNEGYVDGLDTFPPGLPLEWRGQMHLNQAMPGIRVDGATYWLSNQNAVGYSSVTQTYNPTSNTVETSHRLTAAGNNILVTQFDFAPNFSPGDATQFPTDAGFNPQRHLAVKRLILRNDGPSVKTVNIYFYMDPALNGGDGYDAMFIDPANGAMTAFDKTARIVTGTGTGFSPPNEYNPTTDPGYEKNVALYLSAAMKRLASPGAPGGTLAADSWRDTSADNSQGWIGQQVTLAPGIEVEFNFMLAGAHDRPIPAIDNIYNSQLAPVINWFAANSMQAVQAFTDAYWTAWLTSGVTIDTPDDDYDALMNRSLLATALHCDGINGGVIAGFHNGAYPYVWPRDAVYAAVTLARTGHLAESAAVYNWMHHTTYRDFEPWGRKGFWKQKYTTDGYVVWGAPQVDETAVFPWGLHQHYLMTADFEMIEHLYDEVRDSVLAMSQDSSDSRLRFEEAFNLMYSNNVWEDSYDTFIYSNANVHRGLKDAAAIATILGEAADAADATSRMNLIKSGLDARLDWDGENTDISQLGIVYPFNVYPATDFKATRIADRIHGVRRKFNNAHCCVEALVNFSGEHQDTINRYHGDTYWNGGPWFLSTLWYGLYYADRQDQLPGKADIDNHKSRLDLCLARLGPMGLGAEQMAYGTGGSASLLYPGQQDFKLQAAWPNAWESMSTLADSLMAFIDYQPDAPAHTMRFEPKLPTAWSTMTFSNITLVHTPTFTTHKVSITVSESTSALTHTITNNTGLPLTVSSVLRSDLARCIASVTKDGAPTAYTLDNATGRITVSSPLNTGAAAQTVFTVLYLTVGSPDFDGDGDQGTDLDIEAFFACLGGDCCATCGSPDFDQDGDQGTDLDIEAFFRVLGGGAC